MSVQVLGCQEGIVIIADCSQHALLLLLDLVSDAAKDASKNFIWETEKVKEELSNILLVLCKISH